MFENNLAPRVLDTLKFSENKIFLKDLHAERSFEALCLLNSNVNRLAVFKIYDQIESEFCRQVGADQMLRLIFKNTDNLDYEAVVVAKVKWLAHAKLQLITEPRQSSGLGLPNYKWVQRDFWTDVLKNKDLQADDVICLNELGQITETSRCNLFFYDSQVDQVFTPSLSSGCINGVYRRYVMQTHLILLPDLGLKKVIEFDVDYKKIATYEIYVANSVREVIKAELFFKK